MSAKIGIVFNTNKSIDEKTFKNIWLEMINILILQLKLNELAFFAALKHKIKRETMYPVRHQNICTAALAGRLSSAVCLMKRDVMLLPPRI